MEDLGHIFIVNYLACDWLIFLGFLTQFLLKISVLFFEILSHFLQEKMELFYFFYGKNTKFFHG